VSKGRINTHDNCQ